MTTTTTIEPGSEWISVAETSTHPADSVRVLRIVDRGASVSPAVLFSPLGGGFVSSHPARLWHKHYRPVTQEDYPTHPHLAYFYFDESPAVLGWTFGGRWNGWARPIIAESALREWVPLHNAAAGGDFFRFQGDELLFDALGDGGDPEDIEAYRRELLKLPGHDALIPAYDVGGSLCWNQTLPEEVPTLESADFRRILLEAVLPDGFEHPCTFPENLAK